MVYCKYDNGYVVRFEKGEEVVSKLEELCKKEAIKLGSVSAIGAASLIKIGLFHTHTKSYEAKVLTGDHEITSLTGNISTMNGEVYLHLHITVSNEDLQVFGGHLNELIISATCEMMIHVLDGEVDREFSEEIGLNLFKF